MIMSYTVIRDNRLPDTEFHWHGNNQLIAWSISFQLEIGRWNVSDRHGKLDLIKAKQAVERRVIEYINGYEFSDN